MQPRTKPDDCKNSEVSLAVENCLNAEDDGVLEIVLFTSRWRMGMGYCGGLAGCEHYCGCDHLFIRNSAALD